ncbi:phage shock envelope stress response protein PspM [Amycolatopsis lurida]
MGSGKRDFGELSAKLEKHIERLPDYAQRAQEKLQKYLPPNADGTKPGEQRDPQVYRKVYPPADEGQEPTRKPSLPVPKLPNLPNLPDFASAPAVDGLKAKWVQWNEPAAKLERRKRRASRAATLWLVLALISVLVVVAGFVAAASATAALMTPPVLGGAAGAIAFSTLGVRSATRLRQLNRMEVPASTAPPPLPPSGSAARRPMERLAESEASLRELLRQLAVPSTTGVTAVPEVSVEDARNTADEAAKSLRGLAARIQAIERARNAAPQGERAALDGAVRTLAEQLDDGLEGFGALVAAAGRTVAASSDGIGTSKEALTDATDRLAGLAIALRELGS